MRILVCDDRKEELESRINQVREGWVAADLPGEPEIEGFGPETPQTLSGALEQLFEAAKTATPESGAPVVGATVFDAFDLVFIDNNLSQLTMPGARHTAETVAGWIRALSSASYLVSLNRADTDFDLQSLVGDKTTLADVALNAGHLPLAGLWRLQAGHPESFRPWYWPSLATAHQGRQAQIRSLADRLDTPILSHFEFPPQATEALSRSAVAVLSPDVRLDGAEAAKPGDVTFRSFFISSSRSISTPMDRDALAGVDAVVSRVVASELEAWLRREVLGPQDVLVDVPHLLLRMPFLLGERALDLNAWNGAVASDSPPYGLEPSLYEKHLSACVRPSDEWLDRPTFWWPLLNGDAALAELYFSPSRSGDFVFAEDVSAFVQRLGGNPQPEEFAAEVDSPWNRRHVVEVKPWKYAPRSRLAA